MKRLSISFLAAAISLLPTMVQAQGRTPRTDSAAVGGDLGVYFPDAEPLERSLSLDGFYEYYFAPRMSIRLGGGWTAPGFERSDASLRMIRVGGDFIYNWERGAIHPFAGGGLGIYIMQPFEDGDDLADSESKLGAVLLGGVEFFTSNTLSVKAEGSFHFVGDGEEFGPRNRDGVKLSIGLKKYF